MKLAVFFPASLFSAWACSYGLVDALRRMGHEVTSVPLSPDVPKVDERFQLPIAADGWIISGPEHLHYRLERGRVGHVPTVAWLHETVEREDYGKLDVDAIKRSADIVFCPGIQDEKYGFRYLPFGVDTKIFALGPFICDRCQADENHNSPCRFEQRAPQKSIDAGFIGLLYPKRQKFLAELDKLGVKLTTGNVQVLELGGVNPRKTAELYAENIRRMKVFVNLPTLSQLAVTKIYEVLACGVPILTPKIEVEHLRNFGDLPVAFYEPRAKSLADQLAITSAYYEKGSSHNWFAEKMHESHRLELRCEVLVSALKEIGVKESVLA